MDPYFKSLLDIVVRTWSLNTWEVEAGRSKFKFSAMESSLDYIIYSNTTESLFSPK